jgi:hypothetical protein
VPFVLLTTTSTTASCTPGGLVQRRVVSLTTTTLEAKEPPKFTTLMPAPSTKKPVPVSVIWVPPWDVPAWGERLVRLGRAWKR